MQPADAHCSPRTILHGVAFHREEKMTAIHFYNFAHTNEVLLDFSY